MVEGEDMKIPFRYFAPDIRDPFAPEIKNPKALVSSSVLINRRNLAIHLQAAIKNAN